jgi:glycerophosphoryl diester phosphodiesterase
MQLVNRLNVATGREAGVYPEIKSPAWHKQEGIDISPMVLEQIRKFHGSSNEDLVYVQCFDDAEVRRLKLDLKCPWKLVQLIGKNSWNEAATDYDALRRPEGLAGIAEIADGIGPHTEHLYSLRNGKRESSLLVEQAHELGLTVHPYTFRSDDLPPDFDSLEELVRFCVVDIEVDGLFTDFTDQVIEILEQIESDS